jgi:protein-tyrosine-phosphatase
MSQCEPKRIARAEVDRVFDEGIKQSDVMRIEGLNGLAALRGSKAKLQAREESRLQKKYGADHPRTRQVSDSLDANADYISGLKMDAQRSATQCARPDERTWVVQGRVYDRRGCPVVDARVAVYSADCKPVDTVKPATTDNRGYYKISYQRGEKQMTTDEAALLRSAAAPHDSAPPPNTENGATGMRINSNIDTSANTDAGTAATLESGIRINSNITSQQSVFVRAIDPGDDNNCADSTLITPTPGACNYRDLILNIDQSQRYVSDVDKDRRSSRYLGNSSTRELHDIKNEKTGCQIDEIRIDRCVRFKSIKEAEALGYDYCAYCFGKDKSRR